MTAIIVDNIKRLGLREFQRAMYEHIREPEAIILEKFKKPHLVLLPYKEYMKLREASMVKVTIHPQEQGTVPLASAFKMREEQPLTFWQRVKKILNTKLF